MLARKRDLMLKISSIVCSRNGLFKGLGLKNRRLAFVGLSIGLNNGLFKDRVVAKQGLRVGAIAIEISFASAKIVKSRLKLIGF